MTQFIDIVQQIGNFLLATALLCGALSHLFTPSSKIGRVLNVIGMFTLNAAKTSEKIAPKKPDLKIVSGSLLIPLLFIGCVPSKKIWDIAYDTCVAAMKVEPIVAQVAQKKDVPIVKYAEFLCNVVEVLDPFVDELVSSQPTKTQVPTLKQALKTAKVQEPAVKRALNVAEVRGLLR